MSEERSRAGKTVWIVAAIALCLISVTATASLDNFYAAQKRLPLWDMAGHGWGGVSLLRALEQGRPLRFLDLLNRQDKWPFGYSLLLLPFLALGNASFASATLLSTVLFALAPLLLLWAAREVDPGPAGLWGGLLAASLFLTSPLLRVFAILVMREMAGLCFSLLAFCLYLGAHRLGTPLAWRLAGLTFLALFLIKYNYALVWGTAVLIHEVWRLAPNRRRELARRALRLLRPGGQAGWKGAVLAVYLDLLIIVTLLRVNPGVGIYAGLVVGAVVASVRLLRDPHETRERWRSLPVEIRTALATVVLPLWIWCLSPQPIHPKTIFEFLRNRSAGSPLFSIDSLSYYFRVLAREYTAAPLLGVLILLLFAAGLIRIRRSDEPLRFVVLTAAVGLALAILHRYKEPRFLAVAAPFLMLAAAMVLSRAVHGQRPPRARVLAGGLLCAGAIAAIGATAARADLDGRLARDYTLYSARPAFRRPLELLAGRAAGARQVAVIGTFNELSESLVRWRLAMDVKTRHVLVVKPPSRFAADLPQEEIQRRLRRWLDQERPARILAIRLLPESPFYRTSDYQLYNAWQLAAIDVLEKEPGWQVRRGRRFKALELEIVILRRSG
ncbi:MAG TPA: hypothetical protein VGX68_07215 [Thermoanaerobaculia bacterium]|nr:hypothetical protein [Thermoanaerobaculia bacterium]